MQVSSANLPTGRKTYFDQNGDPLAGGTVTYYTPGTTDLVVVYQDDQKVTASPNPVTLDAAGSCISFGVGEFREYVLDSLGNLISDSIVVAGTPLEVSDAMLPVLEAKTVAEAEALLAAGASAFPHITVAGDQTLHVAPTGNPSDTLSSLTVQGNTTSSSAREFLVNFGMNSPVGATTPGADKVTMYAGMDAQGGADVWAVNTLLAMEANTGSYNAQCIEVDFNNHNASRGNTGLLAADLSAPVAVGVSISGSGKFASTAGLEVVSIAPSGSEPQWARGILTVGTMGKCGYQDFSNAPAGIQLDGNYSIAAINLTGVFGNGGAQGNTAMFLRNNQTVTWQSGDATNVISDFVDGANNRYVGLGSNDATSGILMGARTAPHVDALDLGVPSNRWGNLWGYNIRLVNTGEVTWATNPSVGGGQLGFVIDWVNNTNDRIVGEAAETVFMGASTVPQTPGFDLGTSTNTWGNIFSTGGIVTPSDPDLKKNITTMDSTLDKVMQIDPIEFSWRDDDKTQYGFNANDIEAQFEPLCEEKEGIKYLYRDGLVPVLWKAVQELAAEVASLKSKPI